jgi:hypothetical protein
VVTSNKLTWTRTVNTNWITVYESKPEGYRIEGRGSTTGQRLHRSWRLKRGTEIVEELIGRFEEAKMAAERDYFERSTGS